MNNAPRSLKFIVITFYDSMNLNKIIQPKLGITKGSITKFTLKRFNCARLVGLGHFLMLNLFRYNKQLILTYDLIAEMQIHKLISLFITLIDMFM